MSLARACALIIASRQITTSAARSEVLPGYFKLKEAQKAFQVNNGLRIHERGGPKDKIRYNPTLVLAAFCGVSVLRLMYRCVFPKGLTKGIFGDY
jgi:hypothetical protein